ncbi:hypothetical protein K5I29_00885 [Flavobacterium agricola]|uniref:Uncharacterized protein n=1 Tax=Flavobacterium agricola TaxID=2870839 RepID=A0ABY6M132_9FLAO|nr:hypothetical protein [Flavobacterium agricola]UYW01527.1 hypothetical protein K5I29_00885 [Flavobacterium agricola]
MHKNFDILKEEVQAVIDHIGKRETIQATAKHIEAHEILDELIDFVTEDAELIQVSYYQVLLNQLHQKIQELKAKP